MSRTLHITMGLPGCGKTTWAIEKVKSSQKGSGWRSSPNAIHLEMDNYRESSWISKSPRERLVYDIQNYQQYNECIVDSFMTQEDQIIDLLKEVMPTTISTLHIHYWVPNVEYCLYNDKGRREQNSITSIIHAVIEKPNSDSLSAKLKEAGLDKWIKVIVITEERTVKKPEWKLFYDEVVKKHCYMDDNGYIKSESWSLGGTWADCWDNHGNVSAEPQPETFDVFDKIMEEVAPSISFIQYRRLWSDLVDTDTYGESDYYGGSTTYAYYKVNVSSLYNALVEKGLYNQEK